MIARYPIPLFQHVGIRESSGSGSAGLARSKPHRPCLSSKQKRAVIEAYLQGDPEIADNALAEALGVSKNTVRAVSSGVIPLQDSRFLTHQGICPACRSAGGR